MNRSLQENKKLLTEKRFEYKITAQTYSHRRKRDQHWNKECGKSDKWQEKGSQK